MLIEPGRFVGVTPFERVEDGLLAPTTPKETGASDGPIGSNANRLIRKQIQCEG
jgi:hypothetical protein